LNEEYINLCDQFSKSSSHAFNIATFTGKAFVSFEYQHYRDYLVRQYEDDTEFFKIGKRNIAVYKADQPDEIYWENMKVPSSLKKRNGLYSIVILFIVLLFILALLVGLKRITAEVRSHFEAEDAMKSTIITQVLVITTTLFNKGIAIMIAELTDWEMHSTKSARCTSIIYKMIAAQTLNTSLIYFILYLLEPIQPLAPYGLYGSIYGLVLAIGVLNLGF
jgi:hypothetical protein